MRSAPASALVATLVALAMGCGGRDPVDEPPVERITDIPNVPGGNPLVPEVALLPYPSDLYLVDDPATATGRRLVLPEEALPHDVPASAFAAHDGFTRAPAILAWLEGGVDPATLPSLGESVEVGSPVLLVREGTWEPVPVLVELDGTTADPEEQALILRPQVGLDPAAGYAVILRGGEGGLTRADGSAHAPVDAFRALRDGVPTDDDTVEGMRDDFALFHDAVDALGLERSEVVLGWTFHTRSEEQVVGPTLAMHDAMMEADLPAWSLVSDEVVGDNRLVVGTVPVPDFLGDDDLLTLDAAGLPMAEGERELEFLVTIPLTVDEPRPVILFGHGFFSAKEETTWGSLQQSLQPWRMSTVSADFIGFNEGDAIATVAALGGDLEGLVRVVNQQLQSQAQYTMLARLVREQLGAELSEDRGAGPFAPLGERVVYMGISNGGTQGSVITAASPAIDTAALVVPGGAWSHMLQRAVQWNTLGSLYVQKYPDPLELQVVLALVQNLLDPVDILNYAPHLTDDPFPGRTPNQVTLHMAVGDAQVANMVTEWVARSAGIPLVTPSPREVWGLDTVDAAPPEGAAVGSALLIYDEGYPPNPEGNVPPLDDNGAHETIRDLLVYRDMVGAFLEDGTILQVCDGPCDPD